MSKQTHDLGVHHDGSVSLLRGLSPIGKAWISEHIPHDAMTWGTSIVVEHRYINDIIVGAQRDGLMLWITG